MTLLAINTEKSGSFYFMGEDEKRRVLFTSGFHQARRFATPEAAHRVRESARFFNAVREQFPGAESVSIEPEAAGIRKLFNLPVEEDAR